MRKCDYKEVTARSSNRRHPLARVKTSQLAGQQINKIARSDAGHPEPKTRGDEISLESRKSSQVPLPNFFWQVGLGGSCDRGIKSYRFNYRAKNIGIMNSIGQIRVFLKIE